MPTATFTADFTKWNEALRNAQAGLKPLEVSAKGVQQQLQRMVTSFSGTNIQKQAQLAVAAVNSIGGVTKLTEAEQKKLNATVTEAIAKYTALGQKAPADMLAIAKATKQTESSLSGLQGIIAPLGGLLAGAFAIGTIKNLAGEALQFASDLNDLSAKTGLSVEALQEFKFAGDQVGVTLDDVSTAILGMQKHLVGGDKSVTVALKTIGLTFKDLKGLHPEDQFSKIATGLSKIEDPAVRNKTAFDLMGKSAAAVLPLIASDLDAAREKARSFGAVLDQDTINKLDDLGDTWAAVKVVGEAFIAKAIVPLAPAMTQALQALLPLANEIGRLPALFLKAEIAATRFAKKQVDDAAAFLSSPAGKIANPIGALTGQTQKEVEGLRVQSFGLNNDLILLQRQLDGLGKSAVANKPHLAAFNSTLGATDKGADEAAKALQKLKDELTGADIVQSLRELEKAWNALTPAEQKQALAVGVVQKKYVDLASKLPELPKDLRAFAVSMNDAADQAGLMSLKIGELKPLVEGLGRSADATGKAFKDWGVDVGFEATIPIINLGKALKESGGFIDRLPESLAKTSDGFKEWEKDLGDLSQALANLAQISGGAFGGIVRDLSTVIGATHAGLTAFNQLGKGLDQIHGSGGETKDLAKGFLNLSSGILGAVSAAISFGKALYDIFKKDRAKEEVKSIADEFGAMVSKEFGQQIEDLAKNSFGGNRQAAKIFDLDQIISQGGGITAKNLDQLTSRLHDVYSMIETGAFTADQAQSVLDKNFQGFVDFLGGRVSPALKEIIRLNDEFATHSKAIAQYVDAQANSALSSLSKVVNARQSALDALNNAKTPEERKKATAQLDALPLTKNSEAAFGGALFGIFERLQKDGVSAIDTLKQIDPIIESLDKQFKAAGIAGGSAFDTIKSLAGIATDEIAGPSFEAIQNYGAALDALNNAGILDQEQFSGLSDQITATYQAAVAALTAEGKDGSQALGLVAPQLQEIWELQQDFGYAVDDSTQKLLDQAVAAGDVGEKHRSIQEQTLDAMKDVATEIQALGVGLGITMPNLAQQGANGIVTAMQGALKNGIDPVANAIKDIPSHIPISLDVTQTGDIPETRSGPPGDSGGYSRPYSMGGPVYASQGFYFKPRGTDTVPAMLTPGEFVVDRSTVRSNGGAAGVRSALSGGGGTTVVMAPGSVVLNGEPSEAERLRLAKLIMKLGPKVIADGDGYGDWQRMVRHLAKS